MRREGRHASACEIDSCGERVNPELLGFRGRIVAIYAILVIANLAAWIWSFIAFVHQPVLIGTAVLAYSLGLRHAIDADHIAAIDNVTRKLMQEGSDRSPLAFSLRWGIRPSLFSPPLPWP